jgi:hypothetical protein
MITLHLTAPAGPQPAGRPVTVTVELRNEGASPVVLPVLADGSEEGARFPVARPTVRRGSEIVAAPPMPEDPLFAPLRADKFRAVPPGEAIQPGTPLTFANFTPREAGEYTYELEFSTDGEPERWLGRFNQDADREAVLALIAQVPRFVVKAAVAVRVS